MFGLGLRSVFSRPSLSPVKAFGTCTRHGLCQPVQQLSTAAERSSSSGPSSTIPWTSTSGVSAHFHPLFLRDHCLCSECTHAETRQRLTHTSSIPLDVKPRNLAPSADGLAVTWPDGHESFFPVEWLRRHAYNAAPRTPPKRLWTASQIQKDPPSVEYQEVMKDDQALLVWLKHIAATGLCFVNNAPSTPEATEALAERMCVKRDPFYVNVYCAFIRETHYGRFWDFTADLQHADTAYTDIPLGLHTDSTYFSDPVGLQMFHLLSDRTTHEGGHSILSDGFLAAQKLKHNHPVLYELLSTLPVPTHASGGADARFEPLVHRPMLEHNHWGELVCVRYNNDDRAPVGQGPAWQGVVDLSSVGLGTQVEMVPAFYLALRKFDEAVNDPTLVWEFPMQPGRPFIFDNKRVLHGRTGFRGQRRLCGAYINGDDYHSRLKALEERYPSA